jgi:hypothetical protein
VSRAFKIKPGYQANFDINIQAEGSHYLFALWVYQVIRQGCD